jgi:hypothetical protein
LRIIVIEICSTGGFVLEDESGHYFLLIKVLFWGCGSTYFDVALLLSAIFPFFIVVPLFFIALFIFYAIIIDLVPNKWY